MAGRVDAAFGGEPLDLVFDDASHLGPQTRASFETLFPRLGRRAYIIEDWSWHLQGLDLPGESMEGSSRSCWLRPAGSRPDRRHRADLGRHRRAAGGGGPPPPPPPPRGGAPPGGRAGRQAGPPPSCPPLPPRPGAPRPRTISRCGMSPSHQCCTPPGPGVSSRSAPCGVRRPSGCSTTSAPTPSCTSSTPSPSSTRRSTSGRSRVATTSTGASASTCCPPWGRSTPP